MAAFADGRLAILVATTVIEVGVDVTAATVMIVEHAERFGLAQLHQLRGRVGRGTRESFCMLLYKPPLGEAARQRLEMMEATEDGFLIAEKDLELRGGGEVLGARQSGMPEFRIAAVPNFEELLGAARDDARLVWGTRPDLPRGEAPVAALSSRMRRGRAPFRRPSLRPAHTMRPHAPAQAAPGHAPKTVRSQRSAPATAPFCDGSHLGCVVDWIRPRGNTQNATRLRPPRRGNVRSVAYWVGLAMTQR